MVITNCLFDIVLIIYIHHVLLYIFVYIFTRGKCPLTRRRTLETFSGLWERGLNRQESRSRISVTNIPLLSVCYADCKSTTSGTSLSIDHGRRRCGNNRTDDCCRRRRLSVKYRSGANRFGGDRRVVVLVQTIATLTVVPRPRPQ